MSIHKDSLHQWIILTTVHPDVLHTRKPVCRKKPWPVQVHRCFSPAPSPKPNTIQATSVTIMLLSLKLCCPFKNPALLCIQHLLHCLSETTYNIHFNPCTSAAICNLNSKESAFTSEKKPFFLFGTFLSFYKADAITVFC